MKKSVHLPSQTGNQPVRVLKYNILDNLLKVHIGKESDLAKLVEEKGLKRDFGYIAEDKEIIAPIAADSQIPFVDADKRINLPETFLSYVWCLSYSILVLYDFNHKRMIGRSADVNLNEVLLAEEVASYGISLVRSFSRWDVERLPNPELYDAEKEPFIELANGVFSHAMTFILSHELAHVALGDIDEMNRANMANVYVSAHDRLSEEFRADGFATKTMLQCTLDQQTFTNRGVGIIVGVMCLLLLQSGLSSKDHPDIDERIEMAMDALELDETNGLWLVGLAGIKLWDVHYKKNLAWPQCALTPKQAFQNILAAIRKRKAEQR